MTKYLWNALGVAALVLAAGSVSAQEHLHDGDIELSIVGGKIMAVGGHESEYGTGYGIFEGSLDTLLSGPRWRTTDPGFDSDAGTFQATDALSFAPIGALSFWDGAAWGAPGAAVLAVRDSLDEVVTYSGTGTSATSGFTGFIADGGPTGSIHQHVTFTLQTAPLGAQPAVGAYRIAMQLTSPSYTSSDPFWVVFNRGLGEEAFEESIHAMAVPEPETYALMGLGLGLIGFVARRRRT